MHRAFGETHTQIMNTEPGISDIDARNLQSAHSFAVVSSTKSATMDALCAIFFWAARLVGLDISGKAIVAGQAHILI